VKFDGWRAQVAVADGRVTLRTRTGHDITAAFPELAPLAAAGGRRVILDAELVCLDRDGLPDFAAVGRRAAHARPATIAAAAAHQPARLMLFDLLHLDGDETWRRPWRERRQLLEALRLDGAAWATPRWFRAEDEGEALHAATAALGLEGIVAKRIDGRYQPGRRSAAAQKHKHWRREHGLYVSGWRPAGDHRPEVFFLRYADDDGTYAGEVSHGLSRSEREELRARVRAAAGRARRDGTRALSPGAVRVDVDHHGRAGGRLRDPILRALQR